MDKISTILSGWRNHIAPPAELKELIQSVSKERLAICTPCQHNSTKGRVKVWSRCKECGCPLIQKSKALQASCPIDKWAAVTTPEEAEEIKSVINGESDSKEGSTLEASDSN